MFDALQALDVNQDDRISREEWGRALSKGGAVQLMGWGVAGSGGNSDDTKGRKKGKGGGLSFEELEAQAEEAARRVALDGTSMAATRRAGFPLTELLRKVRASLHSVPPPPHLAQCAPSLGPPAAGQPDNAGHAPPAGHGSCAGVCGGRQYHPSACPEVSEGPDGGRPGGGGVAHCRGGHGLSTEGIATPRHSLHPSG